ncbi:MAG: DUF433 domain-containing protein [Candidatus Bipolaricaulota bacterium]|nr:DUF433 domain-containing protein [Candidatus Bipolaricaulota bacterium]
MEIAPRITVGEKVAFGKPVIKGTRVPVELVISQLAGGMTYEEVMRQYDLAKEDILAALDYAAKTLAQEEVKVLS